jgi:hypothetical protein
MGGGIGLYLHSRPAPLPPIADLALPAPDLSGAQDLAAPADLRPVPDLAPAPDLARPLRKRRTGPPIPPLRGPEGLSVDLSGPTPQLSGEQRPAAAPGAEQKPAGEAPPVKKRPKRTGPPIPPLRL